MHSVKPLVSIIMPVYNAEKYLAKAIESILNQTYKNIELLIAEDGSDDGSQNIIERYRQKDTRIKVFNNRKNYGYLLTCNKLMALSSGGLISFQDADDWSEMSRIEEQVKIISENEEVQACSVQYRRVSEDGNQISLTSCFPTQHDEIKKKIPEQFPFIGAGIMVTRKVLEDEGAFHNYFAGMGSEHLHWFCLIILKYKVLNSPKVLYNYRSNPNSVTSNNTLTLRKLVSTPLVQELIKFKIQNGYDLLNAGKTEVVRNIEKKLFRARVPHKSLSIRLAQSEKYNEALLLMVKNVLVNPLQEFSYYKILFYYLRMYILREISRKIQ